MFKSKKMMGLACALALSVCVMTGCGGDKPADKPAAPASTTEVKVGVNYELSGGVASYGQSSVDGIMMAIDEINAAGGINGMKIVPVTVDNKSEPAEATSVATKLMTKDGVSVVLGPATSGCFKAEIPIAEKNGIPIISGSATADDVTNDAKGVKEHVFKICFNDSFQGTAGATFAATNLGKKKAAIIMDSSSDYAKGLAESFATKFEALGGAISTKEAYVQKDTDFNSILTKIKSTDFDVIYLPGYYQEAGLIIKQARALGITCPIIGADGFDSPTLTQLAGAENLNDIYFTNHYSSVADDAVVQKFISDFKAKYNKEPDAFNALGYDLGKFMADAIGRAGSADSAAINAALASTANFTGVTGSFSIDEKHNAVKTILMIGLKNGLQDSAVPVESK